MFRAEAPKATHVFVYTSDVCQVSLCALKLMLLYKLIYKLLLVLSLLLCMFNLQQTFIRHCVLFQCLWNSLYLFLQRMVSIFMFLATVHHSTLCCWGQMGFFWLVQNSMQLKTFILNKAAAKWSWWFQQIIPFSIYCTPPPLLNRACSPRSYVQPHYCVKDSWTGFKEVQK